MSFTIPKITVGEALKHESLSVFPLFVEENSNVDYILAEEAISGGSVIVKEVSETGSVPELFVENNTDERVLFIEGDELIGAKQNRILNTSVLVAARSKMKVPVSCVEQGRWHYGSRSFGYSGSHSSLKLKYTLKKSVMSSLKAGTGHFSNQGQIWEKVRELHLKRGITSPTLAMSDAFSAVKGQIEGIREKMKYINGATGLAVGIGDKIVALDLFDKPATCKKVWNRLLSGFLIEALGESVQQVRSAHIEDVKRVLGRLDKTEWKKVETVGEGEDFRAELPEEQISILAFNNTLVHGSVLIALD
jgi:hypothetical protein